LKRAPAKFRRGCAASSAKTNRSTIPTRRSPATCGSSCGSNYGEFVLLTPRLHLNTLILWLAPLLLIGGGVVLAARIVRRQPEKVSAPPLSPEEQKELDKLLAPPPAKS